MVLRAIRSSTTNTVRFTNRWKPLANTHRPFFCSFENPTSEMPMIKMQNGSAFLALAKSFWCQVLAEMIVYLPFNSLQSVYLTWFTLVFWKHCGFGSSGILNFCFTKWKSQGNRMPSEDEWRKCQNSYFRVNKANEFYLFNSIINDNVMDILG